VSADPIARRQRLSATGKLALSAEILFAYARARRALGRRSLPDIAAAMPLSADPARGLGVDPHGTGLRLGAAVTRLLGALPRDPRCLRKSLVLAELLARRGIPATVVIGVRADPFAAHAWVEHDCRPLLPPANAPFERLLEVSTCPR
jgi:Transglutaminase-like superfamily